MGAIVELRFPMSGEHVGLLFYSELNVRRILGIRTNLFCDSPVNTGLRENRHIKLTIGPPVDIQKERLGALPDMWMDCRRKTVYHRGANIDNGLVCVSGIES